MGLSGVPASEYCGCPTEYGGARCAGSECELLDVIGMIVRRFQVQRQKFLFIDLACGMYRRLAAQQG